MRTAVHCRVVSMLALVVASATSACGVDTDCEKHVQRTFTVSLPSEDAMLDYAANVCQIDGDQCIHLCEAVLARLDISANPTPGANNPIDATISGCSVRFESSDATVDIGYQFFNHDNSSCFVPLPVDDF